MCDQALVADAGLETDAAIGVDKSGNGIPGCISGYDHGGYVVINLTVYGYMGRFGCDLLAGSGPVMCNVVAALPFTDAAIRRGCGCAVGRNGVDGSTATGTSGAA